MKEYICKQDVLAMIESAAAWNLSLAAIHDEIENLPSVDVEPVRTVAEWIPDDYEYYHCSECGYEHDSPELVTPYCPCCGAKMDGGEINAKTD